MIEDRATEYGKVLLTKRCPKCTIPLPNSKRAIDDHLRLWCTRNGQDEQAAA